MNSILKTRTKHILTPVLILAICLAMAFPYITAEAGTSVKAQAQQPVLQFYKYAKTLNFSKMSKNVAKTIYKEQIFTSEQSSQLDTIFRKENKKYFSYKINSTTLSKDKTTATVRVLVSYRSLFKASYYATGKTYAKSIDYYFSNNKKASNAKKGGWFVSYFKEGINKHPSYKTRELITVKTRKYKSGWKIESVTNEMTNSFYCNFNKGSDKALFDILYK